MMMWYGGNGGWAGWLLMTIAMVLFWALIITAVVLIVRYLVSQRPTGTSEGSTRTPEEVLAKRYARSEIDDEEYQRRQAPLRQNT
jgi:putative membrane protein